MLENPMYLADPPEPQPEPVHIKNRKQLLSRLNGILENAMIYSDRDSPSPVLVAVVAALNEITNQLARANDLHEFELGIEAEADAKALNAFAAGIPHEQFADGEEE
jgi:hypothetical protein